MDTSHYRCQDRCAFKIIAINYYISYHAIAANTSYGAVLVTLKENNQLAILCAKCRKIMNHFSVMYRSTLTTSRQQKLHFNYDECPGEQNTYFNIILVYLI